MVILCICILSVLSSSSSGDQIVLKKSDERSFWKPVLSPGNRYTRNSNNQKSIYFHNSTNTEITTLAGNTTLLNCTIYNIGKYTVSWIREKDLHILTVGNFTYTRDTRFSSHHLVDSNDWILQINRPNKSDEGLYECQVGVSPRQSKFFKLNVLESITKIAGEKNLYLKMDSSTTLKCVVKTSKWPPDYILWEHDGQVVKYDYTSNIHEEFDVVTTISYYNIESASSSDAGVYSCSPLKAANASINLYIVNNTDERPAAMQHGKVGKNQVPSTDSTSKYFINFFLLIFSISYALTS